MPLTKEERYSIAASFSYTLGGCITALGLGLGALGLYLQWESSLAFVIYSIFAYALLRLAAGAFEAIALGWTVKSVCLASLSYTAGGVITALGLGLGALGLYKQWESSLAFVIYSIFAYAILRFLAGVFEAKALSS